MSENDGGVSAAISCLDRGTREANIPMGGNGSLWSEEKWSVCQRLGLSPKQGAARDGCAGRRRKKRIISGEQFTRERQAKEPAGPRI